MEFALILSGLMATTAWLTVPVAGPLEVTLAPRAAEVREVGAPLVVMLSAEGDIYVDSDRMSRNDLTARLAQIDARDRGTTRIFVRAHPTLSHGKTVSVMQLIVEAGFENIALVPGGNSDALERGFGAAKQ